MRYRVMHLARVAGVSALLFVAVGCASAPVNRPREMGPVDTGAGSLEATRRALEGTWSLVSLEVVDAGGARRPVMASGQLTYDGFGNMMIRGVVEDPALRSRLVLDYEGRIVIDTARREFRAADLSSDRPAEPSQIAPISPDKVRRYELNGNNFIVTYLDASSAPTAVATWRRVQGPAATPAGR